MSDVGRKQAVSGPLGVAEAVLRRIQVSAHVNALDWCAEYKRTANAIGKLKADFATVKRFLSDLKQSDSRGGSGSSSSSRSGGGGIGRGGGVRALPATAGGRVGEPQFRPPASEEQIAAAEARLGVRLPNELRAFYRSCANGLDFGLPSHSARGSTAAVEMSPITVKLLCALTAPVEALRWGGSRAHGGALRNKIVCALASAAPAPSEFATPAPLKRYWWVHPVSSSDDEVQRIREHFGVALAPVVQSLRCEAIGFDAHRFRVEREAARSRKLALIARGVIRAHPHGRESGGNGWLLSMDQRFWFDTVTGTLSPRNPLCDDSEEDDDNDHDLSEDAMFVTLSQLFARLADDPDTAHALDLRFREYVHPPPPPPAAPTASEDFFPGRVMWEAY